MPAIHHPHLQTGPAEQVSRSETGDSGAKDGDVRPERFRITHAPADAVTPA